VTLELRKTGKSENNFYSTKPDSTEETYSFKLDSKSNQLGPMKKGHVISQGLIGPWTEKLGNP